MNNTESLFDPGLTHDDIAVVGMACLFPGAPDLDAYWQNIIGKVDAVSEPPPESWSAEQFYDPHSDRSDRVYCKRGGYISPLTTFDPLTHGIMPRTVEGGEPDQWLALQIARAALDDAGYGEAIPERERSAVIIGKGAYLNRGNLSAAQHGRVIDQTLNILQALHPEYTAADLETIRATLRAKLPPFNADTAAGLIPNITAGRIANRLNLMGPSYTVDGACASSLLAVEMAAQYLHHGQCDLALVGGVHVVTPVPVLMLFSQLNALSRSEEIRPFDEQADGTLLGEGIGMVVLQRLADARRDGRRVYAVIKGVGTASDGTGLSVMAPRLEGEVLALQRAYQQAGLEPRSLGLIEAHGTGTPVGDRTELEALRTVFGPDRAGQKPIALGSVKSMISHTMPAAGMAGIIKTALALYHKVLPPTLKVNQPIPALAAADSLFYLNTETRPWVHAADHPRRAGVNAFGFGGINAHVILEAVPQGTPYRSRGQHWDSELFLLHAPSRADLLRRLQQVQNALAAPDLRLADLAYTLNTAPADAFCLAIIAADADDLQTKLSRAEKRLQDPARTRIKDGRGIYYFEPNAEPPGQLAFMFPGEGSQYVNMLADLYPHFPEVQDAFDSIDRIFVRQGRNYRPSDFIFPPPSFDAAARAAGETRLRQMQGAVEAVLTANLALSRLLGNLGLQPDVLVGHSTGEYSALLAAGVIDLADEAQISRFSAELNRIYAAAPNGSEAPSTHLFAVAGAGDTLVEVLDSLEADVYPAMINCPHQTVLVCPAAAAADLTAALQRSGLIFEALPFDRPYHTPLFAAYAAGLEAFLQRWISHLPDKPLYSCTSAQAMPADLATLQQLAYRHWLAPVEFARTVQQMHADGVRTFIEVGAGGNLTAFVDDILRSRPHLAVAANLKSRSGLSQLQHLLGLLAAQHRSLNLAHLYRHRSVQQLDWLFDGAPAPPAPAEHPRLKLATGWPLLELSADEAAALRPATPAPPARPAEVAMPSVANGHSLPPSPSTPASPPAASTVMQAHFATMKQFLDLQTEVMETYLGGRAATATASGTGTPPAEPAEPASKAVPAPVPETPEETGSPAVASPETPSEPADIATVLRQLISERTGYPPEMLDLDLDLEADLGIDSIKRVEIVGLLRQRISDIPADLGEALSQTKTLRGVLAQLARHNGQPDPVASDAGRPDPAHLPFIDTILEHQPGLALVARSHSAAASPWLQDHALGGPISQTEPDLRGLALMPFTMSLELMAEAASLLAPGQVLFEVRQMQAHRWLMLDQPGLVLEIRARVEGAAIKTELLRVDKAGEPNQSLAEAHMHFAATYPAPPLPEPLSLPSGADVWPPARIYREVLFHGPTFQGIRRVNALGDTGAAAVLTANPVEADTLARPILLDQPGQVLAVWAAATVSEGRTIFPYRLDRLRFYGPPPEMSVAALSCAVRVSCIDEAGLAADMQIRDAEGQAWAEFVGWHDRRFYLPPDFQRFLLQPQAVFLGRRVDDQPDLVYQLDRHSFPPDFFHSHGGIWQAVLAQLVLSPAERAAWQSVPATERLHWLFTRLAIKDAARLALLERGSASPFPADLMVLEPEPKQWQVQGTDDLPAARIHVTWAETLVTVRLA